MEQVEDLVSFQALFFFHHQLNTIELRMQLLNSQKNEQGWLQRLHNIQDYTMLR